MPLNIAYATGTEAVATTEWSCNTDSAGPGNVTDAGIYQLFLDLNDMVLGDVLQIRLYEEVRAGDTQRVTQEWILRDVQGTKNWCSDSFMLGPGWDFTLDALAGTITVLWSIRRVS